MNTSNASAAQVEVHSDTVLKAHMDARAYFADSCTSGSYDPKQYLALNLLGKRMRFSVDVSKAGCGCNAALYLTSMQQNEKASECFDYYCDANSVCGESCAEIDIMEANRYAWHSTLHAAWDGSGLAAGFGGGSGNSTGPRDFTASDYGPGARCIDTNKHFQVEADFLADGKDRLEAMEVTLSQIGHSCSLAMRISNYPGMPELSRALRAGMTPIVSYWSADDMLWMDGEGADRAGVCHSDDASKCGDAVKMFNFSMESLPNKTHRKHGSSVNRSKSLSLGVNREHSAIDRERVVGVVVEDDADSSVATARHSNIIDVVPMPKLRVQPVKVARGPAAADTPVCSATGSKDCRHSRCCLEAGVHCFEKNDFWAACLSECKRDLEGDGEPWTCKRLTSRSGDGSTKQEEATERQSGHHQDSLTTLTGNASDCGRCSGHAELKLIGENLRVTGPFSSSLGKQALVATSIVACTAVLMTAAATALRRRLRNHSRRWRPARDLEEVGLLDVEFALGGEE